MGCVGVFKSVEGKGINQKWTVRLKRMRGGIIIDIGGLEMVP